MKSYKKILLLSFVLLLSDIIAGENWKIIVSNNLKSDEAIKVALEDLMNVGPDYGVEFIIIDASSQIENNTILVGNETRNEIVKNLVIIVFCSAMLSLGPPIGESLRGLKMPAWGAALDTSVGCIT